SLGTNPSFAAMEHEIHLEPPSPVRCQGRISFHRVSSAHSEKQPGWGQDSSWSSPHPDGRVSATSGWSLLSSWHRPREPPHGRQRVLHCLAEVPPWGCVAAPKDHARTWIASYLKLAPSLRRFEPKPYFHEADYCPAPGDHTRRPETFPV